jgi:carbon monoxide dehydrogenase subunit G
MQFENDFEVASPIDTVWDTLLDVEQVAPCMPGAEVLEQTGESSYKVSIKVRLGPVSMQYRGDVEIVDPDRDAHAAKLVAKATEARGQGTANAEIGMKLEEQNGKTRAVLTTDLRLSGRAAAMGQGIVKDVAGKLTETFAQCLATKLEGAPAGDGAPAAAPASAEGEAEERRDVSGALEPEAVQAAVSESRPEAEEAPPAASEEAPSKEAPSKEPPKRPSATPEAAGELPAMEIAASVVADRLRKPGVLAGTVAVVFVVGFAIGRLRR